jgi:hypothetical protein
MRKLTALFILSTCLCHCGQKSEKIHFVTLSQSEFDAKKYKNPSNRMIDSLKHVHDSCMGISFDANAILAGEGDHLFIGDILKKQSMEVVGTL